MRDAEVCSGLRNFGVPSDEVVLELLFWHIHSLFGVFCLKAGTDYRTVTSVGLTALLLESGAHWRTLVLVLLWGDLHFIHLNIDGS